MKTVIRIQDLVFTLPSRSILKGHFRFLKMGEGREGV